MPIVQQGQINQTALIVPNLYVQIVPPQTAALNGVPTNVLGLVGTASWGPVGVPTTVGTMSEYAVNFGPVIARTFDMGTAAAVAVQQGANNLCCVRVTDGTDTAATLTIQAALKLTALYTGSFANGLFVFVSPAGASTYQISIGGPGVTTETFSGIGGSGAQLWINFANAIINGTGPFRGPSKLVTATPLGATTAPVDALYEFASGTLGSDGSGVTSADMIGTDVMPRKGMYALRAQGVSITNLVDLTDTTQWSTLEQFAISEGMYAVVALPEGDNEPLIAAALANALGVSSYALKIMNGDFLFWNDPTAQQIRLVSPASFMAGLLANLAPQNSSLNKQIYGVAGSQTYGIPGTTQGNSYSTADLQTLFGAGVDVICTPVPGGNYWGGRGGINSSLNATENGDNYTRMTNYIASTLEAGMGVYIGQLISPTLFASVRATLLNFLANMLQQGMLVLTDGTPYSVVCDLTNNPQSRTSLGYLQADIQVQYGAINRFFIVNLEGGQTVTIAQAASPQG